MEFLMKPHNYKDQHVGGWFLSEKLDGKRCFWDGGISRGKMKSTIPWANMTKRDCKCTGLWTSYGNVVFAPDWWLDCLGGACDGELYIGPGMTNRQRMFSITASYSGEGWEEVKYHVFDTVGSAFNEERKVKWGLITGGLEGVNRMFKYNKIVGNNVVVPVTQEQLPLAGFRDVILERADAIYKSGGEGVILRNPDSLWVPVRTKNMLRLKACYESEAVVVGFSPGEGKYEGKIGALVVDWGGIGLRLSGMTDAEREPGTFLVGQKVTFKYREISRDGVPIEARYFRKREIDD